MFDSARVSFGSGFEVIKLVTGFECQDVIFGPILKSTPLSEIRAALEPFGIISDIQVIKELKEGKGDPTVIMKAHYTEHADAMQAVAALNGSYVLDVTLNIRLASHKSTNIGKGVLRDGDVTVEFLAPGKDAFVGYSSEEEARAAMERATREPVELNYLTARLHDGAPRLGRVTVRYQHVPPDWVREDLARFGPTDGVAFTKPNYTKLRPVLPKVYDLLRRHGELTGPIDVAGQPYRRGIVRARGQFKSPDDAERACRDLNGRKFDFLGGKLYVSHTLTVLYKLPAPVHEALKSDITILRLRMCTIEDRRSIVELQDRTPRVVKLVANDLASLTDLKTAFERLLRGDIVMHNGEPVWDPFFTRVKGYTFLDDLQRRYKGIIIERNLRRRTIALFGDASVRSLVRDSIMEQYKALRRQTFAFFPLDNDLLPVFMSADLHKLQEELGRENVIFDLERARLSVRGDQAAFKVVNLAIQHAKSSRGRVKKYRPDACPVCFDDVTTPVTLPCGHSWCKTCLHGYLIASIDNKVFPLKCLGDGAKCSQPVPIDIARELLSASEFDRVTEASAISYVQSRPQEFFYCPTPDCPQIYRSAPRNTTLQCPSCLVRICPHCHVEHHEGVECPDPEIEDKKLLEAWIQTHDAKRCPRCKAPIERIAGCNHMTCGVCKTHICWVCMGTFVDGPTVYAHMHDMHGGLGL
ncbi:hypothetical protein K474DRAFT_769682 [Panus rudis PR-1116 ss-1]|nr:hypothetical protein K474DRAFT_769682 [Panus rudis PR-1116 ss-1]